MNKKLSLQICIISVTIIFSIFFFNKIFFKKDFEVVENKEVSISDEKNLIEGIQYFSKDIKGLYFCGGSVHPGGGIPLALSSAKIVDNLIR